jgi:hypothetical protein
MNQDWNSGHIRDLFLERYLLGELTDVQLQAMETRLAKDPVLRARLEALKDHNQIFQSRFPVEKMVMEIEAAAESRDHNQQILASVPKSYAPKPNLADRIIGAQPFRGFAFGRQIQWAGALALLVLAALPMIMVQSPSEPEVVRLKGKPAELRLFRNTPTGPARVTSGDSAIAGEIIQVEFHPGGFAYGAIYSVDGNGSVTLHWPAQPNASTAWSTVSEYRLPEAFELDQAPGFERFHLVVSQKPIDLTTLANQVAASAKQDERWLSGQFPKPVKVITFVLKKAAHP